MMARGKSYSAFGLTFYFGHTLLWLRFGAKCYALKRSPLLFSERYGHSPYCRLPFGWRLTKGPQ
jgi:hypothetical protein